jgi:pimeloyl-ACP methyl ester carboxylesterase
VNPALVLLPSPLTGPSVWRAVAAALPGPVIEMPRPGQPPQTSDEVLAWFLDAIAPDEDVILVAHSNGGLYVPPLTARRQVAGSVFVDAVLPPASGQMPMIPRRFYDFIAPKADADGLLPPWTQWWDEDISGLFPSTEVRARMEREEPRLPLSYFLESLTVPAGWDARPGAFLAFGDTYAQERTRADHGRPGKANTS